MDFEDDLLSAGIPAVELRKVVSVLHNSSDKDTRRLCDENSDVPVLLVTHEKIRSVYRRSEGWAEKDLVYFLKYKGAERDLLLWDERCQTSEAQSIKLDDFRQAIAALHVLYGKEEGHKAFTSWLSRCVKMIDKEVTRLAEKAAKGLDPTDGQLVPLLPEGNQQALCSILTTQSRKLNVNSYQTVRQFLEGLRFEPRIIPTANSEAEWCTTWW
ncbi:MAG: hypothetical protein ABI955_04080 [Nitrospirota bacterium]